MIPTTCPKREPGIRSATLPTSERAPERGPPFRAVPPAANDPETRPVFVLVSLMTHRIARLYKKSNEDCALAFMAAPQYVERIAEDPLALMDLAEFAEKHTRRKIREASATAKREESDDLPA